MDRDTDQICAMITGLDINENKKSKSLNVNRHSSTSNSTCKRKPKSRKKPIFITSINDKKWASSMHSGKLRRSRSYSNSKSKSRRLKTIKEEQVPYGNGIKSHGPYRFMKHAGHKSVDFIASSFNSLSLSKKKEEEVY